MTYGLIRLKHRANNITGVYNIIGRRDISVGIVTGWSGVPIPVTGFSLFQNVPTGSGAHPASYTRRIGVVSRG
jgi:hypothetical protein